MSERKKKILSLIIAVIVLISAFSVAAYAMYTDANGKQVYGQTPTSGTGNTVPSSWSNGQKYANSSNPPITGVRISIVNMWSGATRGSNRNIYITTFAAGNGKYGSWNECGGVVKERTMFNTVRNKNELANSYSTLTINQNSWAKAGSMGNTYDTQGIDLTWLENVSSESDLEEYENEAHLKGVASVILKGNSTNATTALNDQLNPGDRILIEPLYPVQIANTYYYLTMSEYALLAASSMSTVNGAINFDGKPGDSPNSGNIGFIGNTISYYWPIGFYADKGSLDKDSVSEKLGVTYASLGGKLNIDPANVPTTPVATPNTNNQYTWKDLITKTFGVHTAFINDTPPTIPINMYALGDSAQTASYSYGGTEYSSTSSATKQVFPVRIGGSYTIPNDFSRDYWILDTGIEHNAVYDSKTKSYRAKGSLISNYTSETSLYVQWLPYKIQFDGNGGTLNNSNTVEWNCTNRTSPTLSRSYSGNTTLATATRSEYLFGGWTKAENKNATYLQLTAVANENAYANLASGTAWRYTGSSIRSDSTLANNIRAFMSPNSTNPTGIAPLYAVWKPYSVVFNANGGTVTGSTATSVTETWKMSGASYSDETLNFPDSKFSREGYTLVGWTTKANGKFAEIPSTERLYGLNTSIAANDDKASELRTNKNWTNTDEGVTNLYAVWAPNVVLYDVNIDSTAVANGIDMPVNYFAYDNSLSIISSFNQATSELRLNKINFKGDYVLATVPNIVNQNGTTNEKIYIYIVRTNNKYIAEGTKLTIKGIAADGSATNFEQSFNVPRSSNGNAASASYDCTINSDVKSLQYILSFPKDNLNPANIRIYITKEKIVNDKNLGDKNLTQYSVDKRDIYARNEYVQNRSEETYSDYVVLPAATIATFKDIGNNFASPYAYDMNGWFNTEAAAQSTSAIADGAKFSSPVTTVYANWTPKPLMLRYKTASPTVTFEDYSSYTQNQQNFILNPDGTIYTQTFDITTVGGEFQTNETFGMKRNHYHFGSGNNEDSHKNAPHWQINTGSKGKYAEEAPIPSVYELFGSDIKTNNIAIATAIWTPYKYTVTYWSDLGPNDIFKTEGLVSHQYSGTSEEPWGVSTPNNVQYANNNFIKAAEITTAKFNDINANASSTLLKNKFSFKGFTYKGWFAYSEKNNAYCTGYTKSDDTTAITAQWTPVSKFTTDTKLYLFQDEQEFINLTGMDEDIIRMYAVPDYSAFTELTPLPDPDPDPVPPTPGPDPDPDPPTPDPNYPWYPNQYEIMYCGEGNTSHNYPADKMSTYNCLVSFESPLDNGTCASHIGNCDLYYPGIKSTYHLFADYSENLSQNKYAKTGHYIDESLEKVWIASRVIDGSTYIYGTNNGKKGWYKADTFKNTALGNKTSEYYYFADGQRVRNLSDVNDDIVYMHAIWNPNRYKIVYRSGMFGTDESNFVSYNKLGYANYGTSYFLKDSENNPITDENGLKIWEHPFNNDISTNYITYSGLTENNNSFYLDKNLYFTGLNNNGDNYYMCGWTINPEKYNAPINQSTDTSDIYGYSIDEANIHGSINVPELAKKAGVENQNNAIIYLDAVWRTSVYSVRYDWNENRLGTNGVTNPTAMYDGAYRISDSKRYNEQYFNDNYYFLENAFTPKSEKYLFANWFVYRTDIDGDTKYYYAKSTNGNYAYKTEEEIKSSDDWTYVSFKNTIVVSEKNLIGDKFAKLTDKDHGIVYAEAQWGTQTRIYYDAGTFDENGNAYSVNARVNPQFNLRAWGFSNSPFSDFTSLKAICRAGSVPYSDSYIIDNTNTEQGYGLTTPVHVSAGSSFGLSRIGYSPANWVYRDQNEEKNSSIPVVLDNSSNATIQELRSGMFTANNKTDEIDNYIDEPIDIHLIATWKANSYTICYVGNGATESSYDSTYIHNDSPYGYRYHNDTETFKFGADVVLTQNRFVRDGYTFKGWNIEKNGGGVSYKDCETTSFIPSNDNAVIYLYAQWIPNNIIYNKNTNDAVSASNGFSTDGDGYIKTNLNRFVTQVTSTNNVLTNDGNNFGLSRAGYSLIGWSFFKNGRDESGMPAIIQPNNTVYTQEQLEQYGYNPLTRYTLYAQWSARTIKVTYNMAQNSETTNADKYTISSSVYSIDNDAFIVTSNNKYSEFYNRADNNVDLVTKDIIYFDIHTKINANNIVEFTGWTATTVIGGKQYIYTINGRWEETGTPEIFQSATRTLWNNTKDNNDISEITFRANFSESVPIPNPVTVQIKYRLSENDYNNGIRPGNTSWGLKEVDNIQYITYSNSEYITKVTAERNTILNKNVNILNGGSKKSVNINGSGYHFTNWSNDSLSIDGGVHALSIILTDDQKTAIRNLADGETYTVVLTSNTAPNKLKIRYNVTDKNAVSFADSAYTIDSAGFISREDVYTYGESYADTILKTPNVINHAIPDFNLIHSANKILTGWVEITGDDKNVYSIDNPYAVYASLMELNDDVTIDLYAKWETQQRFVVYNTNGGTLDPVSAYRLIPGDYSIRNSDSNIFKDIFTDGTPYTIKSDADFVMSKGSDRFIGWSLSADGSSIIFPAGHSEQYDLSPYYDNNSDTITLYAQWEPNTYKVHYMGNGATGHNYDAAAGEISVFSDEFGFLDNKVWEYNKPDVLTENAFFKSGYAFAGYWTDIYGNKYNDKGTYDLTSLVNEDGYVLLYAQWEPITYTITFDGNGETSGDVPDQDFIFNEAQSLNSNVFVKDYYHSDNACWIATREVDGKKQVCTNYNYIAQSHTWENIDSASASPYIFADEEMIINLADSDGEIITMTAQWIPNKLTIEYNTNTGKLIENNRFELDDTDNICSKDAESTDVKTLYSEIYEYEPDKQINLGSDTYFHMYKTREYIDDNNIEQSVDSVFDGWTNSRGGATIFSANSLQNIPIDTIAPELISGDVFITLYASWGNEKDNVLTYYEGETVTLERLTEDVRKLVANSNFTGVYTETLDYIDYPSSSLMNFKTLEAFADLPADTAIQSDKVGTYTGEDYNLKARYVKADGTAVSRYSDYGTPDNCTWELYTYFNMLEPGEEVVIETTFAQDNTKEIPLKIHIIYNNPPEITAVDRWFSLSDAKSGKITRDALLETAVADDFEGSLKDFSVVETNDNLKFTSAGDYTVHYTATDSIPVVGRNKTTVQPVIIHIVDGYSDNKARFISDKYYPLVKDNVAIDENGNFIVKRVHGVFYYTDTDGNILYNGDTPYSVDSGFTVSSKILLNKDGTYTVIPMSKWYTKNSNITALKATLQNHKDESNNWSSIQESWYFTASEIKAIKENIKTNSFDENFYANQYLSGHAVIYSPLSAIANQNEATDMSEYFNLSGSAIATLNGFSNETGWTNKFGHTLFINHDLSSTRTIKNIADNAFANNQNIENVHIVGNIEIGSQAFAGCSNLKVAYVPKDIEIPADAFPAETIIIRT